MKLQPTKVTQFIEWRRQNKNHVGRIPQKVRKYQPTTDQRSYNDARAGSLISTRGPNLADIGKDDINGGGLCLGWYKGL
jgi:hypothetical protein